MKNKMKKSTVITIVLCFIGLSLLLYPTISNYWNSKHSSKAISNYVQSLEKISDDDYQKIWNDATSFNTDLLKRSNQFALTDELKERYAKALNVSDNGVMGYIEIPKLDVSLPIYHGTSEGVLQSAVGHLDWSSLPVGGNSSHCVLSGHRGLPSAKLFTDLDRLREGDMFTLHILNEILTYEIDQIRTVEPKNTSDLAIIDGKDYCTLVTCTPYGLNTHRMLVRGHRIENSPAEVGVVSDAIIIAPIIVALTIVIPLLFIMFLMVMFKKPNKKPQQTKIISTTDTDK